MRFLRGLLGGLLWVVASLVGLVAALLCVTLILLPVGIPLLRLSRRLFGAATGLMLPRALTHPVDELGKRARRKAREAAPSKRTRSPDKLADASRRATRRMAKKTRRKAARLRPSKH